MLECAIHPITYRGEGILATVVKNSLFSMAKLPTFFHKNTSRISVILHTILHTFLRTFFFDSINMATKMSDSPVFFALR